MSTLGARMFVRWLALPLAFTVLALPARLLAQEQSAEGHERVQLSYQASPGCPGSASFHREVMARLTRPVEWVFTEGTIAIRVQVVLAQSGARGRLDLEQTGSAPSRRDLEARTCEEVSSALALVVALTLDPNARTEAVLLEPAASPAPRPVPLDPKSRRPAKPVAASPTPKRRSARVYIGPAAGASGGHAPASLITLGAVVGVRSTRREWFAPLVQLTPLWGRTGTTGPTSTNARFAFTLMRLDACPSHLLLSSRLALVPCLSGEAGRLAAEGRGGSVVVTEKVARPWVALGPSLGLRFNQEPWFGALAGSAMAPLIRDQFVFLDPRVPIHEAPAVVFAGLVAIGVEL